PATPHTHTAPTRRSSDLRDEDGARDAPVLWIRSLPNLLLAGAIVRPVAGQPVREQEVRVHRVEVALAHGDHALRVRRDDRADDLDRKSTRLNSSHVAISY